MTYQFHLRIGDDLEEFLRAFADARGLSISAAVRVLLYEARARGANEVHMTPAGQIGEITR